MGKVYDFCENFHGRSDNALALYSTVFKQLFFNSVSKKESQMFFEWLQFRYPPQVYNRLIGHTESFLSRFLLKRGLNLILCGLPTFWKKERIISHNFQKISSEQSIRKFFPYPIPQYKNLTDSWFNYAYSLAFNHTEIRRTLTILENEAKIEKKK